MDNKYGLTKEDVFKAHIESAGNKTKAAKLLGVPRSTYRDIYEGFIDAIDSDLIEQNVRLAKQKQAAQDLNRISNKAFRENARIENALEVWLKDISAEIKNISAKTKTKKHEIKEGYCGVLQFSDVHFNEIVDDVAGNKYDFFIASARIKRHADHAIKIFKAYGVTTVYLCFTADMYNSDRRLDELLNNSTNRAKGFLLGYDICRQLIQHLNQHFNVVVASVCGNEARIDQHREYSDIRATNNFDFMLHEFLRRTFDSKDGIHFINGDPTELVMEVNGQNFLLVHGDSKYAGDPFKGTLGMMAKYSAIGIKIRYVLSGHIHMAYLSDYFSRSGSTVGNNAYSHKALNLTGRASQNLYLVAPSGNIHAVKIDLQEYDIENRYDVTESLIAYNAKSADKCHTPTVIHQIII